MNRRLVFTVVSVATAACGPTVEEIHMLPDGYTGPVLIIFQQPGGTAPEYRGAARVYRIPSSGVLKTQFSVNYGYVDLHFYRGADTIGPGIPTLVGVEEESAGPGLYVFSAVTGSYSRIVHKGDTTATSGDLFAYRLYFVGEYPAPDSVYRRAKATVSAIAESLSATPTRQ